MAYKLERENERWRSDKDQATIYTSRYPNECSYLAAHKPIKPPFFILLSF